MKYETRYLLTDGKGNRKGEVILYDDSIPNLIRDGNRLMLSGLFTNEPRTLLELCVVPQLASEVKFGKYSVKIPAVPGMPPIDGKKVVCEAQVVKDNDFFSRNEMQIRFTFKYEDVINGVDGTSGSGT